MERNISFLLKFFFVVDITDTMERNISFLLKFFLL